MKKLIRKPNYPLQQMILRLREKSVIANVDNHASHSAPKNFELKFKHMNGPYPSLYHSWSLYKQAHLPDYMLSLDRRNNCVQIESQIARIRNIFESEGVCYIMYSIFRDKVEFFDYPMPSSVLHIYVVDGLSDEILICNINAISRKYVVMPCGSQQVAFPLIHCS